MGVANSCNWCMLLFKVVLATMCLVLLPQRRGRMSKSSVATFLLFKLYEQVHGEMVRTQCQ